MGIPFLLVYFAVIPAVCTFTLYKFARLWLWAAPIAATVLGTLMMTAYLGGSAPGGDQWLTLWGVLVPIQQLAAISFSLGVLVGMRWGGSLGLAVGGAGVVLGLMVVAVTDLSLLLYPVCLILYALVLVLSFTGKAKKAWEEYRQGNSPE
ncbi:MAG: hypothetical protein HFF10_09780 [Angelakisella sp.]|jgi:hypothetical protein|nr:hypothetical protein [Angelakisella sp.]